MKIARFIAFLLVFFVLVPTALAQTGSGDETTNAQTIELDVPTSISLSTDSPVILNYKGSEDETITITARSLEEANPVDPIISVTDNGGTELATNDDHRTDRTDLAPRDSLIADLTLPSTQRYSIVVSAYDGAGDVEVLITHDGGSINVAQPLEDETVEGEVPDDDSFTYDFQADEGEVVTITVRATDNQLDPKVSLLDSDGNLLIDNDDHVSVDSSLGPYDAQITEFTLPASGDYTIEITAFGGVGGSFELTISRSEGSENPPDGTPQPTQGAPGETQVYEGSIDPNDFETYAFDAEAGDVYVITVQATTDDFDPRLSLYFNGDYINDSDDYGTNDSELQPTDSRLYNQIITESGEYEVDVAGYQESAGNFTLTIERVATGAPTGLPDEQIELGTVDSGDTYTTTFEAQAGDFVTISVRGLSIGFDPYVALLSEDGTVLIDNDDHSGGSALLAFYDSQIPNYIIEEDGVYTVEVSGVGEGETGTFGLTIGTLR